MSEPNRDVLREHEYDGIKEFDNPTPGWWYAIFLITFLFSLWYFPFYHMSSISSSVADSYDSSVADDLKLRFSEIGDLEPDEATILRFLGETKWLPVGETVYKTQCISCHGSQGEGLIGPNLTDDHYKNARDLEGIATVISEGAANGAMPAWKTRLHPNEVVLVSAFVASLRGKNLPGPRGAEGETIPPWPSIPTPAPAPEGAAEGSGQ